MFAASRHPGRSKRRRPAPSLTIVALAACVVAFAAPARADVRIGGDSNGYYRVGVKSWWEIPFRTVVRQQYDFSCGSAAVATLLTYHYNRPTSENMSFVAMWKTGDQATIRKSGFSMLDMKNYLQGLGYRVGGFRLTPEQLEALNQPVIALLNLKGYKHFVVVKGVGAGEVLLGDPALGLRKMSIADFTKSWNGIVLGIIGSAGEAKPVFNLASEWDPWARAPTRAAVDRRSIGDVTTFLPPIYQLTTQLQIDLRGGGL
jgi:predicted double-glycine peptidase